MCNGDLELVQTLYQNDQLILNQYDGKGGNIITLSSAFGHLHVLQWAINSGVNIQCVRNDGATPLLQAALHGHLTIIQFLILEQGVDINETDANGDTAIMHAAGGGHLTVVQWLVDNGADLTLMSKSRSNALHRAATTGHLDVVKYLLSCPDLNEHVNTSTARGCTALHYAARNKHIQMIQWLVEEAGASTTIRDSRGDNLETIVRKLHDEELTQWFESWKSKNKHD